MYGFLHIEQLVIVVFVIGFGSKLLVLHKILYTGFLKSLKRNIANISKTADFIFLKIVIVNNSA